jgi:hypothetical protein
MPGDPVDGATANGTPIAAESSAYDRAAAIGAAEHRARGPRFRLTPKRAALIVLGVLVFLAISVLLARFLQTENVERDDDLSLIETQAKGDVQGMLSQLAGCRQSAACAAAVRANAVNPRLLRSGEVKILQLKSATAYSLTGSSGRTRLAWTVIGKLPVVQCIGVRRTGNFLSGVHVTLTSLSPPIPNEADC